MEESYFDETASWSTPKHCSRCRYPMAFGVESCPSCRRPARLLSSLSGRQLWGRVFQGLKSALSLLQMLLVLLVGMTLAYYLSPVLLLFPLVALSAAPPASRGGKTVVHGRPRTR